MGIHRAAAQGFAAAADVYERARPGYPDEAVAWLAGRVGIGRGRDVLDLAAGTGKLTRSLVPFGARVIAVEPVAEMRAQLVEAVPDALALEGTAEAIPLPDGSVDAVTCAQAFHWFRHEDALAEIHRVLRARGASLALVWNSRDERDALQARISEILAPHRGDVAARWEDAWRLALDRSRLFGPLEHRAWPNEQRLPLAGLLDRVASTSFVAATSPREREAILDEVSAAAEGLEQPILCAYITDVFVVDRR